MENLLSAVFTLHMAHEQHERQRRSLSRLPGDERRPDVADLPDAA
jgi:hypothetical protein